jgi:hypothetical protein
MDYVNLSVCAFGLAWKVLSKGRASNARISRMQHYVLGSKVWGALHTPEWYRGIA